MYEEIFDTKKRNEQQKWYNDKTNNATTYYQKIYGFKLNLDPKHRTWNVEADAFKHAYVSALMSLKNGDFYSMIAGQYHENQTPYNPTGEKNMDLWNNNIGRKIANEIKNEYGCNLKKFSEKQIDDIIAKKIMQKMNAGKLITTFGIPREYQAQQAVQDGDLIWVDDYTRSDGTPVKGYYRSK